ncbi:MAG: c-type cytochrome [Planctomycetes bacterium]|nr:c-type cytochrome [Planctomycetota bacterium]
MNFLALIQAAAAAAQPTAPAAAQATAAQAPAAQAPVADAAAPVAQAAKELLPQASTFAASIDDSFLLILWFAVFLAIVVAGAFAIMVLRPSAGTAGSTSRALYRWSAVGAFALVAVFFVQGARVWADMQVVPRGAVPVRVALEEKGWSFTYPNGYVTNELHLPIDRAVKLTFQGASEPYTFAVPAFRLQIAVPVGTRRDAWVQPTLAGDWEVRSTVPSLRKAEELVAQATVHAEGGYEKWYQDISGPPLDLPPVELGQRSYQMRGCTQCHTVDGAKLVGPTFKGFLAREHRMKDGSVVDPSDDYIKESILDPQAKVVEGFEPVMPSFKGRLHELEVAGLAAYIKSLQ